MNKRMKIMIISLAVVFGGIIAFNGIKSLMIARFFAHYQPPAVTVSSAVAQAVDWRPSISTVGNFVAIHGVDVSSEAAGNVMGIHFNSGQYILKGQPLITIDDRIDQSVLKSNQAELVLKELNYKRQVDLLKKGATPGSSVDEANANLQQAQAKVEQTQVQIIHKHLVAPFNGHLGIRQVNLGEYVSPGKTIIVSLQSLDPLYLEFYLPEQLVKQVHANQTITFVVEGFPNILFEGIITALNSKVDLNTHNVQVQARLPNCPAQAMKDPTHSPLITTHKALRSAKLIVRCDAALNKKNNTKDYLFIPGMFASIQIEQAVHPHTVIIPSTAISYSLYGNAVYLIEKSNSDPKKKTEDGYVVRRVFVSTGEQQGNYTVIKQGIKAGEMVVNAGDLKLQNGTRVAINNTIALHTDTNPDTLNP